MSLTSDWHERHGATRSKGRLLLYIVLLAVTVFLMLRAGTIMESVTDVFFSPDSSTVQPVAVPE
jgi:hypothetical protein